MLCSKSNGKHAVKDKHPSILIFCSCHLHLFQEIQHRHIPTNQDQLWENSLKYAKLTITKIVNYENILLSGFYPGTVFAIIVMPGHLLAASWKPKSYPSWHISDFPEMLLKREKHGENKANGTNFPLYIYTENHFSLRSQCVFTHLLAGSESFFADSPSLLIPINQVYKVLT